MIFIQRQELSNGSYLFIQPLNTPSAELLKQVELEADEKNKVLGFKLEIRRRQYLEARKIVQTEFSSKERIVYTSAGKPELRLSRNAISLSHSGDYLAVLLDAKNEVGIDLQLATDKIQKIAKRFIHPEEFEYVVDKYKMHYYHTLWCAKEALFKYVEEQGIDFKENLRVDSFEWNKQGVLNANVILAEQHYCIELAYQKLENYYLVYTFNH